MRPEFHLYAQSSVNAHQHIFEGTARFFPNAVYWFPYNIPVNITPQPMPWDTVKTLFIGQLLCELPNELLLQLIRNILSLSDPKFQTHPMVIESHHSRTGGPSRLIRFNDDVANNAIHDTLCLILPRICFDRTGCYFVQNEGAREYAKNWLAQETQNRRENCQYQTLHVPRDFCTVAEPNTPNLHSRNFFAPPPYLSTMAPQYAPLDNSQQQPAYSSALFHQQTQSAVDLSQAQAYVPQQLSLQPETRRF